MNTDEIILVVEDEKEIADLLEVYLTNEGFKVLKAECSKDALDHIGKEKIALAILDIMLPDIDGLTLCRTHSNLRVKLCQATLYHFLKPVEHAEYAHQCSGSHHHATYRDDADDIYRIVSLLRLQVT